jgi:pyruvate dehydrogenase E2 component (dihydrolipoamide acetyltransferase)
MPIPITVPRLGWSMEEGVFLGWLKAEGEPVQVGEALFALESEKASEDVESLDAGILHIPADGPRKGDVVAIGAVLGYLLQPGEKADEIVPSISPTPSPVRDLAAAPAPPQSVMGMPPSARPRPTSSPRARRTAANFGIDWKEATGTGRTGRIRERDVLALVAQSPSGPAAARGRSIRRVIAERLLTSHRSTVPVTLTTTIDATNLVRFRDRWKAEAKDSGAIVPSYTDLFIRLTALALDKHPALNARWDNDRIVPFDGIHIGIAVDTDAGLLVPVVRDVLRLPLKELAIRTRDLIDRARQGMVSAGELQGGTFTVTSLGAFGIDAFTPIINYPECAILGIGRIRRCPAVVEERIVICDQVTLSLTFDHRITDGSPAARFVQILAAAVASGNW